MKLPSAIAAALLLATSVPAAEQWTRFRGPNGSGVSSDTGFPVEFGAQKNLLWKIKVRPGKSSPVLTDRHVFLTAFENGRLFTQCFDRRTGKLLWEQAVERAWLEHTNPLNNPAAITPVTDGANVYAFFKDYGLVSYDPAGALRWKTPLGPFSSSMGLGASPILAGDFVVLVADQRTDSFIAAFDRRNGETRWKIARDEAESWGTPVVHDSEILTASRGLLGAHRVADGKRALTRPGVSPAIVASPILDRDTLFVFGYGIDDAAPFTQSLTRFDKNHDGRITPDEYGDNSVMVAIGKYVGNGDGVVTEAKWNAWERGIIGPSRLAAIRLERGGKAHELWHQDKNFTGVVPSPLLYQGALYVVKNGGILTSFDAESGAERKTGRVQGAIAGYSASPVAAEGRIYLANEDGKIAVVKAQADWETIAVNDLDEPIYATPALSEGRIYLRTQEALYCFGR